MIIQSKIIIQQSDPMTINQFDHHQSMSVIHIDKIGIQDKCLVIEAIKHIHYSLLSNRYQLRTRFPEKIDAQSPKQNPLHETYSTVQLEEN